MDSKEHYTQHYNLKWNNFKENLLQIFAEQLDRELLTDVAISCEGKLIKAHRIVLSACSIYFQNLFEEYSVPNPLIILNGVKLEDLKQILTFMYLGEIKVSEQNISTVLTLANDLQVKGLSNIAYSNIMAQNRTVQPKSDELLQPMDCSHPPLNSDRTTLANHHALQDSHHTFTETSNNFHIQRRQSDSPGLSTDSNISDNVKSARPPIAFMIFASEWRAKLSEKYPEDNNKEISVRLSTMWKRMPAQQKAKYYYLARKTQTDKEVKSDLPVAKRKREQHQKFREVVPKPETDEDVISNRDSSDGLEIVEEETELIEIEDGPESTTRGLQNNRHVQKNSQKSNM